MNPKMQFPPPKGAFGKKPSFADKFAAAKKKPAAHAEPDADEKPGYKGKGDSDIDDTKY